MRVVRHCTIFSSKDLMNPYCPNGILNALSAANYRGLDRCRPYCWSDGQITRLLDDIVRAGAGCDDELKRASGQSHFLGTILVADGPPEGLQPKKILVDGHQRLTTVALIIMSMIRHIQERHDGVLLDARGRELATADDLLWRYVREDGSPEKRRYRLELPGADGRALKSIIDANSPDAADASHVYSAYRTICSAISSLNSLRTVLYGLQRLDSVAIKLPSLDNALEIFNDVNARAEYR